MAKCSQEKCGNRAKSMCLCVEEKAFLCDRHFQKHFTSPGPHECISLQEFPDNYTNAYLVRHFEQSQKDLGILKKSLKQSQISLAKVLNSLDDSLIIIEEKIEQIGKVISVLGSKLENHIKSNLKIYQHISGKDIERVVAKWEIPLFSISEVKIPNFSSLSYFNFLDRLTFPNVKILQNTIVQFEIPEKDRSDRYYLGKIENDLVSVKLCPYNEATKRQVIFHGKCQSNNPDQYIRLLDTYKKNNRLQIVTEPWKHTLWNEISSRSEVKVFFPDNLILEIFKLLLTEFKNIPNLLCITPNIFHYTSSGIWKIWFPSEIQFSDPSQNYCAYEIGNSENAKFESNAMCNLYSIGLVILQAATLLDTSQMYRKEREEELKNVIMTVNYKPIRMGLIGILVANPRTRANYTKTLEVIEKTLENFEKTQSSIL